jgi:hypothetical protein
MTNGGTGTGQKIKTILVGRIKKAVRSKPKKRLASPAERHIFYAAKLLY